MSISISRTCYFENKCPQTRMNTGFADSFAKYDTLLNFFMEKDAPRRPFVVFRVRPIGSDQNNSVFSDTLFNMPIFRTWKKRRHLPALSVPELFLFFALGS